MTELNDTPQHTDPATTQGPVFVDTSGRRLRRVRIAGGIFLGLVAGYVVLLVVAMLGGPNIAAPYLPQPTQALAAAPASPQSWTGPAPMPAASTAEAQAPGLSSPILAARTAAQAGTSGVVQQQPVAPAPTAAPAPTSSTPGKSGTAPGQTTRPTQPSHP